VSPLWGERGCIIYFAVSPWSRSPRIHNHALFSQWRLALLYPRALGSLSVAYFYSPDYCGGILACLHAESEVVSCSPLLMYLSLSVCAILRMKDAVLGDVTPCGFCKNVSSPSSGCKELLKWCFYPKHWSLQQPRGVVTQKTAFFISTAVKTSNLTYY
jgi:hypothetical protein